MKSLKRAMQGAFRSTLTLISPKLNTAVTYRVKFGRKLDLTRPTTFNEKVLWLKFNTYWNNDTVKQCADKLRVRDYLEQHGYGYLLNELIASYEDVDSIDFSTLPDRFAIKLNVGCACNIIVQDKSKLDIEATKNTMRKWLKNNYWLGWSEMQYKDVKPCILIEKYLGGDDGSLPVDYKFYCMNGKATSVMVCEERDGIHHPPGLDGSRHQHRCRRDFHRSCHVVLQRLQSYTGSFGHHVQRVASRRLPAVLHGRVVPLHHETYHLQLCIPPHRLV